MHDIYIKYFKFVQETFNNDPELISGLDKVNTVNFSS